MEMQGRIQSLKSSNLLRDCLKGAALVALVYYGGKALSISYDFAINQAIAFRKQTTLSLIALDFDDREVTFDIRAKKSGRLGSDLPRDELEKALFVSLVRLDQCQANVQSAKEFLE